MCHLVRGPLEFGVLTSMYVSAVPRARPASRVHGCTLHHGRLAASSFLMQTLL